VALEGTLRESMNVAIKRYSSLFKLPSARKVTLLLLSLCVGGGLLSTMILFPTADGLRNGLFLGLGLCLASLIADGIISEVFLKGDAVFNMRRTMALSASCWAMWLLFTFIGAGVSAVAVDVRNVWWIRLSLLGFSGAVILRFVVFTAVSQISRKRLFAVSLLQPFLGVVPFLVIWTESAYLAGYSLGVNLSVFFLSAVVIGFVASFGFLSLLNEMGEQAVGLQSMELFRAFMLNWVSNLNAPFEEVLEKLGERKEVEVSLVRFDSHQTKAVVVVPSIHPGPFKNIGSSLLPAMLKTNLEKSFNCVACVPHGLFGHEYNLVSRSQDEKVVAEVISRLSGVEVHGESASPFVTASNGLATACCQVFGKSAFVSFTLAPKTIEDLPQELGRHMQIEAEKHGLDLCAVVNAHNSIDRTTEMQGSLSSLEEVGTKCLEKALSLDQSPFEVGAASVFPREFGVEDGMGPGGITAIAVKTGEQSSVYVVIDGNNMVSGLRERILTSLHRMGITEAEVFTTDTHAVNALILGRGYHAVGEAIENEELIRYVEEASNRALASLERVKVSCSTVAIPDVKVIGTQKLQALCLLVDKAVRRAKRAAVPVFGASGLLLFVMLLSLFV
jgi:putative membrane protein